jgi:hypothetical protein
MVEADSHLKLLPTSILDMYKVIEHIDMLSMGIQYQPYTVIPTLISSDLGVLGHLWSQTDVITSWMISLTQFYPTYLAQILGFWVTCGVKMMSLCHG